MRWITNLPTDDVIRLMEVRKRYWHTDFFVFPRWFLPKGWSVIATRCTRIEAMEARTVKIMIDTNDEVTVLDSAGFLHAGLPYKRTGEPMTCSTCASYTQTEQQTIEAFGTCHGQPNAEPFGTEPEHFCAAWEARQ